MKSQVCKALEYDKVIEKLTAQASTLWGKELAAGLAPTGSLAEIQSSLEETAEAVKVSFVAAPPLGGIFDIRPALKKLALGAVLDLGEINDILSTMRAMRSVKYFFKELDGEEAPGLKSLAQGVEIAGQLERNLESAIDERGNLRDTASPELARIRRELNSAQGQIKERMAAIVHRSEYQKYFQEAIITVRSERYVIPVKQEYRREFPGLIHDQSATGQTLFVEPMAVVELNNEVKRLTAAEIREVQRIMRELSRRILREAANLQNNGAILAQIDLAFAKAKLAARMQGVFPRINAEGLTDLKAARHPLIPAASVVPIDLKLGGEYRLLLVTGPNTGGKTVSMKTLGLLSLMAQAGLFIPAAEGSALACYENIYADIGDEQSIEQSLSTFSSHMSRLVSILSQAGEHDLLLLDEIGAGTDPDEGAALATAILEKILALKAAGIATTHYSELKAFAYNTPGIKNACVEFDAATLRPTYRLLIGMPGASNAFAISRRLGLALEIIERAKELMQADHLSFAAMLTELEAEKVRYAKENAALRERLLAATAAENAANKLKADISKQKSEIIKKAKEDGAALIRRTQREAEEIIAALKAQFDDQGVKKRQQTMQEARGRLKEAAEELSPGIMGARGIGKRLNPQKIAPGDRIYVTKLAQEGTVLTVNGSELTVEVGSLKTTLKAKECRFLSAAPPEKPTDHGRTSGLKLAKTVEAAAEIDIRGLLVNEAEARLDKFIDDSLMAGLSRINIIHGKGTGALRQGVHAYLKAHPSIRSFALAEADEGGSGATVAELK